MHSLPCSGVSRVDSPCFNGTMKALRLLAISSFPSCSSMRKYHQICSTFVTWPYPPPVDIEPCRWPGLFVSRLSSGGISFCWKLQVSLPGFRITLFHICPLLRPRSDSSLRPASTRKSAVPTITTMKAPTLNYLSRLNSTASALAVYASHYGHPACARLASVCWSDFDGWDLHPLGYKRNFKDHLILFQSTGLSLAPCNLWFLFFIK